MSRASAGQRLVGGACDALALLIGHGSRREPVDTHHLLLGRVNASGQDPRLDRSAKRRRSDEPSGVDAPKQRALGTAARFVVTDQRDECRRAAERRHVVRGVAGAARHDLRGVVLEDQHRRLAGYPRDASIDVLVSDEVADDDHARCPQPPHQFDHEMSGARGPSVKRARQRGPCRSTNATAAIRLSQMASTR